MFDGRTVRRHRLSALANGALIGIGIVTLGFFGLGVIFIAVGAAIEIWQRSRIPR